MPFICDYLDNSHLKFKNETNTLPCLVQHATLESLIDHIKKYHTLDTNGCLHKYKSESRLSDFLINNNVVFTRDRDNNIEFCDQDGTRAWLDFVLYEIGNSIDSIVILENDENQHRNNGGCDLARTHRIYISLNTDKPIIFIRFNPHKYTIDGTTYILSIKEKHIRLLRFLKNLTKPPQGTIMEIYYIDYDYVTVPGIVEEQNRNIKKIDV